MPEEKIKFDKDGTPLIDLDSEICTVKEDNNIIIRWYTTPIIFKNRVSKIVKTFEYNYKTEKWEEVDE